MTIVFGMRECLFFLYSTCYIVIPLRWYRQPPNRLFLFVFDNESAYVYFFCNVYLFWNEYRAETDRLTAISPVLVPHSMRLRTFRTGISECINSLPSIARQQIAVSEIPPCPAPRNSGNVSAVLDGQRMVSLPLDRKDVIEPTPKLPPWVAPGWARTTNLSVNSRTR